MQTLIALQLAVFAFGVITGLGAVRLARYVQEWRSLNNLGRACGVPRKGRMNSSYLDAILKARQRQAKAEFDAAWHVVERFKRKQRERSGGEES